MADDATSGDNEQQDGRAADQHAEQQHVDAQIDHTGATSAPKSQILAH